MEKNLLTNIEFKFCFFCFRPLFLLLITGFQSWLLFFKFSPECLNRFWMNFLLFPSCSIIILLCCPLLVGCSSVDAHVLLQNSIDPKNRSGSKHWFFFSVQTDFLLRESSKTSRPMSILERFISPFFPCFHSHRMLCRAEFVYNNFPFFSFSFSIVNRRHRAVLQIWF